MNNGTTQYTASFHYGILLQSRYIATCFFIDKNYTFHKVSLIIANANKCQWATKRVDLYFKNPV